MSKKRNTRRVNGGDGPGRKKNYRLPKGDHLVVKPIKRTSEEEREAKAAALLAWHWDTFDSKTRRLAMQMAYVSGCEFGRAFEDEPNLEAYVDTCIWDAYNRLKIINEIELDLWYSNDPDDPRVAEFARGCWETRTAAKAAS
jgi:hypothetical protein